MSILNFKPITLADAKSLSELMPKMQISTPLPPKPATELQPTLILPFYQGSLHFFNHLNWENDVALYNDITFVRNDKGQFNAAHLLSQCTIDGDSDKKSIKTISDFITTSPGRELRRRGCFINTTFIDYKWLESLLTYGMKDAVAMTDYLEGREWRRVEGYVYLVKFIESDSHIIYKVGRAGDFKIRAKGYKNEAKKRGASFVELITLQVPNMYISERILINHFIAHGATPLPSKGKEYFVMYPDILNNKAHDTRALELFQQATQ